ncbi:MAG TPA: nuclear transport factor 2 family protein [Ktedonobacterales bacterium]|nr:nuclear transport factor 2 family protein [Ktedonobacterales bacterium]
MDRTLAEQLVRTYIEGWKEYNSAKVRSILDPACILIESDGETFRGAETICHELDKRVAGEYGPWQIQRWDITSLAVDGEVCFVEWDFEGRRGFEGASLVRFKDGKMSYLREYCTTRPRWEASEQ